MRGALLVVCMVVFEAGHRVDANRRLFYEEDPYKGEQANDCAGIGVHMSRQMKEVKCMPRKTLVKLKPQNGFEYMPSFVSVMRCGGMCSSILSCMDTQSILRSITIRRRNVISGEQSCYRVHVEEHTRCKCGCNVKQHHCNKRQVYLEDECACKCTNSLEETACGQWEGMVWSPDTCKCTCVRTEEECSTGLEWIPSLCRCGKVMLPDNEVRR